MKNVAKNGDVGIGACVALVAGLTLGTGCAASVEPEGGVGLGPGDEEGEHLANVSDSHPCGDDTVASVAAHDGTQLTFCVFSNGLETVFEQGPLGAHSAMKEHGLLEPRCGLEVYLELTPDNLPVPRKLVDACSSVATPIVVPETRVVVPDEVFRESSPIVVPQSHYCGRNGATSFASQRCHECKPYQDCYDWCVTAAWGWHARTMSYFLGQEANIGVETNASCNGSTRLRGYWREDVGDSWQKKYDIWLKANYWRTTALIYHSAWLFGQDYDLRLRADSVSGAYHRHSGYFLDE